MKYASRLRKLERAAADPARKYCACPVNTKPAFRWDDPDAGKPKPDRCPRCGKPWKSDSIKYVYCQRAQPDRE